MGTREDFAGAVPVKYVPRGCSELKKWKTQDAEGRFPRQKEGRIAAFSRNRAGNRKNMQYMRVLLDKRRERCYLLSAIIML